MLVILQAIELARMKGTRGHRRPHHHLDDLWRQPDDFMHSRARLIIETRRELCRRRPRGRAPCQHAAHHRVAQGGAAHRLDDVPGKARMEVAEKANRPPVGPQAHQHSHRRGLRRPFGGGRVPFFVERAEITPVEDDIRGILAAQHRVGLRPPATRIVRAGIRTSSGAPSGSAGCRVNRNAAACPKTSTSTSTGVSNSANRIPSSIAFATSS